MKRIRRTVPHKEFLKLKEKEMVIWLPAPSEEEKQLKWFEILQLEGMFD